jgi:serine/threonine protein kinase/tetratricopeptide (TPR) repeat protein
MSGLGPPNDMTVSRANPDGTTGGDTRPHAQPLTPADLSRVYDLAAEFHSRLDAGHPPDLAELCREHPHLLPLVQSVLRAGERVASVVDPDAPPAQPATPARHARYAIGQEIARGGMGEVYRAIDTVLHRDVAVKVLHPKYSPEAVTARRFADEARITAQLQHPGIPAVHDLGTLPDGRPFLAMKLIKGDTLDALLKGRDPNHHDLGRFLPVFEQTCHTLAYAHTHGVIHRDLKPANVMVGAFGEVQVMDWGLAKVLANRGSEPGSAPTDPDATADPDPTEIKSLRTAETQTGSVLGTPAFMAPEQAIGAVDKIDRRTDVFGLGSILAVILTGRPPFRGDTVETTRQLAALGKVGDCFSRLDASGAAPELVALCKRCLSPDPADRPADAGEVATAVTNLRVAADEQARREEIDREKATVQTAERRKRRRQLGLAIGCIATLLLGIGGAVVGLWIADTRAKSALSRAEALTTCQMFVDRLEVEQNALCVPAGDDSEQDTAVARAESLLAPFKVLESDNWWAEGDAAVLSAEENAHLRARVAVFLLDLARTAGQRGSRSRSAADRAVWFARANDWVNRSETAFGEAGTPRAVWTLRAWLATVTGKTAEAEAAARTAGGTPYRDVVDYRVEGLVLMHQGRWSEAEALLATGMRLAPTDLSTAFARGTCLYMLGHDSDAVAVYDWCISLNPTGTPLYYNRGMAHLRGQRYVKAEADFATVIAARGDWAEAYLNRAAACEAQGEFADALADLTKALGLGYSPTAVLLTRSRVYSRMGKPELAAKDREEGMKQPPTDEKGWVTRGLLRMPKDGEGGVKAFADALADFEAALAVNPRSATALQCKARAYSMAGENKQAVAVLTELLTVHPESLDALSGRAMLYSRLGERAKAHADAEEALRLGEGRARTTYQLAGVYAMTSKSHPEDKREAFRLLDLALRAGFGFHLLEHDRELDPIRNEPEFDTVVEEAKNAFERRVKG